MVCHTAGKGDGIRCRTGTPVRRKVRFGEEILEKFC